MTLKHIHSLLLTIVTGLILVSCRSTVPMPSKAITDNVQNNKYKLQNNAPLRTSKAKHLHFTDLNRDGHMDLLVSNPNNSFHVEFGDSTGNWTEQNGPPSSMQPLSFATSDINHNGVVEVLIGGKGEQKGLQIWELNPADNIWALISAPTDGGIFSSVKLTDINHDGWDDIIATRMDISDEGGILVLLNNGQNGWISGTGPFVQGIFTDLSVEDINNDGHLDIVTSRRSGLGSVEYDDEVWKQVGGVQIWYGDGNGRWKPTELPAVSDAESVSVSDLDGDGNLDIIAGLYLQGIVIWWNEGNLSFGDNETWKSERLVKKGTWSEIKVGDIDASGSLELIAASNVEQGIHIWHLRGRRLIKDNRLTPNFGTYLDIDLGDIRGDNTLAIAATKAEANIEVWYAKKPTPLPTKTYLGSKVGSPLFINFKTGLTRIEKEEILSIKKQLLEHKAIGASTHIEITGYPDRENIHTELYPNDSALAFARAIKTKKWLQKNNFNDVTIIPLLHETHSHSIYNDGLLKTYSQVTIQLYNKETSRLPKSNSSSSKSSLYNITENSVFKTISGLAEYVIGAGDDLSITFWQGSKSDVKKVTVQVDGTVSLPYQAALQVAGKTPREIDAIITEILQRFERNPRVDVQLLKARSKHATIFGEINSLTRQPTGPGTYSLSGKESLVDFLSRAGGPGKDANLSSVQITRKGKTIILNLNRAIKLGDMSENAIVDDGDTIFIPSLAQSKRQVYVLGEVFKKGIVEFKDSINFLDAISQSGGLTPDAYLPDIRVIRANRDKPEILAIDFERFMEQGDLTQNLALVDKDIVIIPARPIANWNKYIADISPSITLLLQPVSVAQQLLTLQVLTGQIK